MLEKTDSRVSEFDVLIGCALSSRSRSRPELGPLDVTHGRHDLRLALLNLGQLVTCLHPEPRLGATAEGCGEPHRHFGGNSGLTVDQVIEGLPRDAQHLGALGDAQAQRLQAFLANQAARMGRIVHGHGSFPVSDSR